MSIAHNQTALGTASFPVLLPGPAEVPAEIDARAGTPTDLLLVGLLRRDDSWPLSSATLTTVTAALAWCIRGEDWLGRAGAAEFAVLLDAGAAENVAERLVTAVTTAAGPALSAAAGIATVQPGTSAHETLRRATLSLSTARSLGAGTTIRYAGTR
ncbi:diguanylate cyclase domain-containing protein [Blastococcus sp. TF02A-26]|uniref:diguanylate cyclase domain-containing protein n=1 Tax=Blastococcus sp. TF02A-26 TaxID=2250577 RepID=UPI000DE8B343|nr:diguanylate cyclase [Blastococcus sp. TF02A-26]RBY87405.1 hypothetical protein DQ240_07385 [Blastococcus sp. TF02A-26]